MENIQTSLTQWHRLCAPILSIAFKGSSGQRILLCISEGGLSAKEHCGNTADSFISGQQHGAGTQLPKSSSHASTHIGCTHTDIPSWKAIFVQKQTDLPEGTPFYWKRQAKMSVWGQKLFYVYQKNCHENAEGWLSQACHRTLLSQKMSSQDAMAHSGFYLGHDF